MKELALSLDPSNSCGALILGPFPLPNGCRRLNVVVVSTSLPDPSPDPSSGPSSPPPPPPEGPAIGDCFRFPWGSSICSLYFLSCSLAFCFQYCFSCSR